MCTLCAGTGTFDPGRHPNGGDFATIFEGVDAPDSTSTPYSINLGDSFVGELSFLGDRDVVAITLEAGETYTVSLSAAGSGAGTLPDPYLRVYDSNGNLIGLNDDSNGILDSEYTFTATTSGTYYVSAGSYNDSGMGTYEATVTTGDTPPPPPARGREGTLDELADFLVSGYWQSTGRSARSFDTTGSNQITVNITALTAEGQQLASWALEAWELVADVEFIFVTGAADITFDDNDSGAYAQTFTSGSRITSSNINISTNWIAAYGTTIDSYSFQTYVHEIGHALGLGHQGAYNGAATYGVDETFSNDSWQISVMSYFNQLENTATSASFARLLTPMMADIVAIQSMYGASTATNGRTIWGANSNLGGYIEDVFAEIAGEANTSIYNGGDMAFTIYDNGGRDLIDFSYATQGMRIDLRPETFSDVGGLIGNMAIARGTIIEELFTGSGDDNIRGNSANNLIRAHGGNDTIEGASGNDRLNGGAGNDLIRGGTGSDKLLGNSGGDRLFGQNGSDTLQGGGGNDRMVGGNGADKLSGGNGRDVGRGGAGADTIVGGNGNDRLFGLAGNDSITGGNGNDMMYGGGGNDRFLGGNGNDTAIGGAGGDTFIFNDGSDGLTIRDFSFADGDRLRLDDDLWAGNLTARQVVNRFGTVVEGDMVLDFGNGDIVVLEGVTNANQLWNFIDIV